MSGFSSITASVAASSMLTQNRASTVIKEEKETTNTKLNMHKTHHNNASFARVSNDDIMHVANLNSPSRKNAAMM